MRKVLDNIVVFSYFLFLVSVLKVKVAQSCPTFCDPMDYTVHEIFQARILEWVALPFPKRSSQPRTPTLQVDSLPAEPPGKPKNTGVSSLSLLQGIFPTQELNQGLLHCWRRKWQPTPVRLPGKSQSRRVRHN